MPTRMLTRPEQRASAPAAAATGDTGPAEGMRRQAERVRRLRAHVAGWAFGATIVTAGWIAHEWNANGAFERFAHEGNRGDWNPTLWALVVLLWGLAVGIMALRVHFERPPTVTEIDRLKFHIAAWLLAMVVLLPLNVLIEWQDNGGFERISGNSRPGSWEPWILYVGGIWALVIAIAIALPVYLERRKTEA